jgi:hypothetical protein
MARNPNADGCREFRRFDRRELLRIGSVGMVGLSLPQLLAAAETSGIKPRAKSVLFYHH